MKEREIERERGRERDREREAYRHIDRRYITALYL